jgi:hypothetical protein
LGFVYLNKLKENEMKKVNFYLWPELNSRVLFSHRNWSGKPQNQRCCCSGARHRLCDGRNSARSADSSNFLSFFLARDSLLPPHLHDCCCVQSRPRRVVLAGVMEVVGRRTDRGRRCDWSGGSRRQNNEANRKSQE